VPGEHLSGLRDDGERVEAAFGQRGARRPCRREIVGDESVGEDAEDPVWCVDDRARPDQARQAGKLRAMFEKNILTIGKSASTSG